MGGEKKNLGGHLPPPPLPSPWRRHCLCPLSLSGLHYSLVHTRNFVRNFAVSDGCKWVNSHTKIWSPLSLLHVIPSITFAIRRKIADRIASVNQAYIWWFIFVTNFWSLHSKHTTTLSTHANQNEKIIAGYRRVWQVFTRKVFFVNCTCVRTTQFLRQVFGFLTATIAILLYSYITTINRWPMASKFSDYFAFCWPIQTNTACILPIFLWYVHLLKS